MKREDLINAWKRGELAECITIGDVVLARKLTPQGETIIEFNLKTEALATQGAPLPVEEKSLLQKAKDFITKPFK